MRSMLSHILQQINNFIASNIKDLGAILGSYRYTIARHHGSYVHPKLSAIDRSDEFKPKANIEEYTDEELMRIITEGV